MLKLDWTHRSIVEWRQLLARAPRTNWLQTITLAKVLKDHLNKYTRVAAITEEDQVVGIVSIQEVRIGPVHLIEVFRGPIWLQENPPLHWLAEFAQELAKEYPRSILRRRRWLPEWGCSDEARAVLKQAGFRDKARQYETIYLDLSKELSELRRELDRKWRNQLTKGSRLGLDVRIDRAGSSVDSFVSYHELERKRKGYKGRSAQFLKDEILAAATFKELLILWCLKDEEPVAGIAIVMHGKTGTYRAGWTTPVGRSVNAHNVLLWDAVELLKAAGYKFFDLGGTVPVKYAEGINNFKKGMGGQVFTTPGVFG